MINNYSIYHNCDTKHTFFCYFRDPNFQVPKTEAAKLFRVERIKPVKGNPYWERRILRDFGLFEASFQDNSGDK